MPRSLILIPLLMLFLPSARPLHAQEAGEVIPEPASLVVTEGKIVTLDSRYPRAEALAVRGEWIVAVGTVEQIQPYIGPDTRVVDAGGRLVIPGFNDAHCHFMGGAKGLSQLNLYGVDSLEKVLELVEERVRKARPGEWITGNRYDHTLWGERWPTKEDLDRVAPDNPVRLTRASGHSSWVNSKALEIAGVTKETPDPEGGEIQRDPRTGEATGILLETAQRLVRPESSGLSPEQRRERDREALLDGFEHAAKLGVTSIQTSSDLQEMELVRELKEEGRLTLRWNGWLGLGRVEQLADRGIRSGQGDYWVRTGFLKGFIDGTLGDGTAVMFEPFEDRPDFYGLPQMSQEEMDRLVLLADRSGFQVGIHAIGDRGAHMVLDSYEKAAMVNGTSDMRHRIIHSQLLIPDDIRRYGALGVIPDMQPTHCTTDMRFAEERVGLERCKTAYAWRSLLDGGAVLAFGTDWSVEPLDPMRGVFSSVTRTNIQNMEPAEGWFPEQELTVWESIYYYTWGSAYAEHLENVKGTLAPGRLADMVIMDRDLFTIPPRQILDARVDRTIVGGRVVWDRSLGAYGTK
ncbi:MAG: amidohydrolase family protein [bacterium]